MDPYLLVLILNHNEARAHKKLPDGPPFGTERCRSGAPAAPADWAPHGVCRAGAVYFTVFLDVPQVQQQIKEQTTNTKHTTKHKITNEKRPPRGLGKTGASAANNLGATFQC